MARKVSKNQRTDRGQNTQDNKRAKIVVAVKKENGQYSFQNRVVRLDQVAEALQEARS